VRLLRTTTRLLSHLFGVVSELELPLFLRSPVLGLFCRIVGIDRETCLNPLEAYPSLQRFFLRESSERKIAEGFVSPVDGVVSENGVIAKGELLQAKGRSYTLGELLCDGSLAAQYEGGFYCTLYLSPKDYHHVHSPTDGIIRSIRLISGNLLPVNEFTLTRFDRVFPRNERLVLEIEQSFGEKFLLVMVAAYNVGSLQLEQLRFPASLKEVFQPREIENLSAEWKVLKGARIGSFCLGSTVILILPPGSVTLTKSAGESVQYGERL